MIKRTMDIMTKFTGKKPVGWLGPGPTQTLDTPDPLPPRALSTLVTGSTTMNPPVIRTTKAPLVTPAPTPSNSTIFR